MEKITLGNEYLRLNSDISTRNAEALLELGEGGDLTMTEQVRRATAFYHHAMLMYVEGGDVHSVSDLGSETIPLFDSPVGDAEVSTRVALSVNLNIETAKVLQNLGVGRQSAETSVLDNVINHYYQAVRRSNNGQKLIAESSDGIQRELVFL